MSFQVSKGKIQNCKTRQRFDQKLGIILGNKMSIKFVYSEKATKFCEISTLLLSTVHTDKGKVEILQNFVALEYMNFNSMLF